MPAAFRFDQSTPGPGTANRSRHDLIPGEKVTCVATSPAAGAGVTFTWEILDKRGSAAVLSSTSGQNVDIGADSDITSFCAFYVLLTVNDNGVITKCARICSVRSPNAGLRPPVFGETSPAAQTLNNNDPDLSTDNAVYTNRSGTGVTEQNPFDWTEWAWEVGLVVEGLANGGGGGGSDTSDNFIDGGSGWLASTSQQPKQFSAIPLLDSVGVVVFPLTSSDVFLAKPGWGRMLGTEGPLVCTWRSTFPIDDSASVLDTLCHYNFGVGGSPGDSGFDSAVLFTAVWSEGVRSWALVTIKAGTPHSEPITLDIEDNVFFEVRLTISVTGTKVEISLEDGPWTTIKESTFAPTKDAYFPLLLGKLDAVVSRSFVIDRVDWTGPSTAFGFAGDIGDGFAWPGGSVTEGQVRAALGTSTGSVPVNNQRITNLATPSGGNDAATKQSSEDAAHTAANDPANIQNAIHSASADFNFNNQKLTGITGGSSLNDAIVLGQLNNAFLDGANLQSLASHLTGPANFAAQLLQNVADPSSAQDVATKNYVDTQLGGKSSILWKWNETNVSQFTVGVDQQSSVVISRQAGRDGPRLRFAFPTKTSGLLLTTIYINDLFLPLVNTDQRRYIFEFRFVGVSDFSHYTEWYSFGPAFMMNKASGGSHYALAAMAQVGTATRGAKVEGGTGVSLSNGTPAWANLGSMMSAGDERNFVAPFRVEMVQRNPAATKPQFKATMYADIPASNAGKLNGGFNSDIAYVADMGALVSGWTSQTLDTVGFAILGTTGTTAGYYFEIDSIVVRKHPMDL